MQTTDIISTGPTRRIRACDGSEWDAAPATQPAWEHVLDASSEPHLTQTPEWLCAVVEATRARNVTRMYRSSDGRRMVLPLVASGPSRLVTYRSLPHGWGRGGVVGDGPVAADVVLDDLVQLGGIAARIRVQPERDDLWSRYRAHGFSAIAHVTHIADLSPGQEYVWTSVLSGRTRTKIRKAAKAGVRIESAPGAEYVPVFYELYEAWLRERAERRRLPAAMLQALGRRREPQRKFDIVARHMADHLRIWVAYLEDRPIAAAIQLVYGTHSTYWRGFSLREIAGRTRANYLLQWRMIEEAGRLGCRTHDMGESGGVESLMHFKEVFGATPRPYRELYREAVPLTGPALAVRNAVMSRFDGRAANGAADA